MKYADQIVKWGVLRPFLDKTYNFNTLDIETIDNELFLIGFTHRGKHQVVETDFYDSLHDFLIRSMQHRADILTWTRYDNTHLLKLILSKATRDEINTCLLRVGKVTPIYVYTFKSFTFVLENVIKDSIIIKIIDKENRARNLTLYNLKNLYDSDLVDTAKNYGLSYYSKMGAEFHLINKGRYQTDPEYRRGVIESNRLDNIVLLDIAKRMIEDFRAISGNIPKTIFTTGSLARSYLLSQKDVIGSAGLNFNLLFRDEGRDELLDYAMRAYHGGKIESYVLGFIPSAKTIDITSAYPYAMTQLPRLTDRVYYGQDVETLAKYYYAFIRCNIHIKNENLIHPLIVENPINKSNISPWGYLDNVTITLPEYRYLIRHGCEIGVIDYYAIEHEDECPYREMVKTLFVERLKTKHDNPSLSQMYKIILNSLYGITYELTDLYAEENGVIEWIGYRAGEFFNPIIASYITALTRTYLSEVSQNIIENGGRVYLNMTDSIIYQGECTLDVFADAKVLGKFERPQEVKDVYILGAGRYEYRDEFTGKYTVKNRGFAVSVKDQSFYSQIDLRSKIDLVHRTFVTSFKASTKKYAYEKMGYLIDDTYTIDPFNIGGKRIIIDREIDLNREHTGTKAIYLERGVLI